MLKPGILNALRKATSLSISFDPTVLELTPNIKVRKPGGVFDTEPQTPRVSQTFLVEATEAALSGISGTSGGLIESRGGTKAHSFPMTITGTYDCEMEINDTWVDGLTTYRIISLQPSNGYEKVGVVSALGRDPSYGT